MHRFFALIFVATLACSAHAQVYRCGNSYSQEPCQGGAAIAIQAPMEVHADPKADTVYLCRQGQRQFWSAQSCQSHNASMLYRRQVPQHWSWEQKWQHAEREWRHAERTTATPVQRPHPADTSAMAAQQRARPECAQADHRIRQLDEMGRKGGSASLMERIRKERKELRDWQFNAGC